MYIWCVCYIVCIYMCNRSCNDASFVNSPGLVFPGTFLISCCNLCLISPLCPMGCHPAMPFHPPVLFGLSSDLTFTFIISSLPKAQPTYSVIPLLWPYLPWSHLCFLIFSFLNNFENGECLCLLALLSLPSNARKINKKESMKVILLASPPPLDFLVPGPIRDLKSFGWKRKSQ